MRVLTLVGLLLAISLASCSYGEDVRSCRLQRTSTDRPDGKWICEIEEGGIPFRLSLELQKFVNQTNPQTGDRIVSDIPLIFNKRPYVVESEGLVELAAGPEEV